MSVFFYLLVLILSYLLGTLSPAALLARRKGIDIQKSGSGNPGATNVLRVMGPGYALLTLLVDAGKGYLPTLLTLHCFGPGRAALVALAAFLGHVFPVFRKFRGGKGVATGMGITLAIDMRMTLILFLLFLLVVGLTRYVSLGSILAACLFPFLVLFSEPWFFPTALIMAVLVVGKHRSNLIKLSRRQENKISFHREKGKNGG